MIDLRFRILENGSLEIVDPRWGDIELMRAVEPGIRDSHYFFARFQHSAIPGYAEPGLRPSVAGTRCGTD